MADEEAVAPEEGYDPQEPTPEPEPEGPAEQEPAPEPEPEPEPAGPPPTSEDIIKQAEERAFQRTASWIGRRDKDLIDNIVARLRPPPPPPAPPPPRDPSASMDALVENPDGWVEEKIRASLPHIIDQDNQRRQQAEQIYTAEIIRHAGGMMEADPQFEDKEFGKEVIAEVKAGYATLDKRIPPQFGAEMLLNRAIVNVHRKRTLEKKNPLAGNTPGKVVSGVKPPPAANPKVKVPPLSEGAQKLAKRWGYKEEDLAKVFGEQVKNT